MAFYTYILQSLKDGRYYIGSTGNIVARLEFHNAGLQPATKNRTPLILVYSEAFNTRNEALARERLIKSYKGGNAFKRLINKS